MSYMQILKDIKKKKIAPVYFIYGSEAYFIENLRKQLIEKVTDNNDDSLSVYDLEEMPIQDVIGDAETYPFFSENKLVIATNPVFLKSKPDKLPFEHDLITLENYIQSPVDYTTLVIIAPYEKVDERKKITKLLKKQTAVAECNAIKDNELRNWIDSLAKQLEISITDEAYEIFEVELTANLHQLENEMEKLALYTGPNGEITKEIAEELVSHTTNSSSLRLVDAVIAKDMRKAIMIFSDLMKMKEEPIALIALIAFQFRSIFRVKLLQQQGYSQFQIQKKLGLHPYVVKIALNRAEQFSIEKLERIIMQLTNTDAKIKQGKVEKELAFELLLYELIEVA